MDIRQVLREIYDEPSDLDCVVASSRIEELVNGSPFVLLIKQGYLSSRLGDLQTVGYSTNDLWFARASLVRTNRYIYDDVLLPVLEKMLETPIGADYIGNLDKAQCVQREVVIRYLDDRFTGFRGITTAENWLHPEK